jgi:hypothetical protein
MVRNQVGGLFGGPHRMKIARGNGPSLARAIRGLIERGIGKRVVSVVSIGPLGGYQSYVST